MAFPLPWARRGIFASLEAGFAMCRVFGKFGPLEYGQCVIFDFVTRGRLVLPITLFF